MTGSDSTDHAALEAAKARAERRRRLDAIFGDVLPDQTRDEREPGTGAAAADVESAQDAWLKAQVPPHHG